jgi:hypothetical protein
VLRLLDAHSRSYLEVRPARPGLLLVSAQVPGIAEAADLTGVRVLLVADLLTRAAELGRLQVFYVLTSHGQQPDLERAIDALGIHPPAERADPAGADSALGAPVDVQLAADGTPVDDGLTVPVGAARLRREAGTAAGLLTGDEPLAVRLALLSFAYHDPADVTGDVLAGARATLARWRLRVATWAESPSRPVPVPVAEMIRSAVADLDTPRVLALLRDLEADPDMPAGARFETFLSADRLLGLDLPRDIGRV